MIDSILVKAQNVHDYFCTHYKEHGWEDLSTFVCVKPPFKSMLIVYDHCFNAKYGEGMQHILYEKPIERHAAVYLEEISVKDFAYYLTCDSDPLYKEHSDSVDELRKFVESTKPASILRMQLIFDDRQLPGRWFVFIDANGKILICEPYGWVFITSKEESEAIARANIPMDDLQHSFAKHGAIVLATLSFMNCKNVEVLDNRPTRQQRRLAERESKPAPVTYKTLVIHPFGKKRAVTLHRNGDALQNVSLHICRGHFKDYRNGEGLGKFHTKGVWWWSPQVRGSAERGRVVKDYEVVK